VQIVARHAPALRHPLTPAATRQRLCEEVRRRRPPSSARYPPRLSFSRRQPPCCQLAEEAPRSATQPRYAVSAESASRCAVFNLRTPADAAGYAQKYQAGHATLRELLSPPRRGAFLNGRHPLAGEGISRPVALFEIWRSERDGSQSGWRGRSRSAGVVLRAQQVPQERAIARAAAGGAASRCLKQAKRVPPVLSSPARFYCRYVGLSRRTPRKWKA